MSKLLPVAACLLAASCYFSTDHTDDTAERSLIITTHPAFKTIGDIPPPEGYTCIRAETGSFGEWLRRVGLKADNRVYLYNGELKRKQGAQFAVLDIPVGDKDLQQCADAVMRLRAEYLFEQGRYDEIAFMDNDGKAYTWQGGNNRSAFEKYLETVFTWCGSASLEKQLNPVRNISEMRPGDVLIKGGFPGHAMIVVDMAEDEQGRKLYMLAQSYMPAQDIHVVKNPADSALSPWYELTADREIDTPEWIFQPGQLRRW